MTLFGVKWAIFQKLLKKIGKVAKNLILNLLAKFLRQNSLRISKACLINIEYRLQNNLTYTVLNTKTS